MIKAQEITQADIIERYLLLPEKLRGALDSKGNDETTGLVCMNHHLLDSERALMIRQLVSLVILGFIHPYDLGSEINQALDLNNPKLANSLAAEINEKIFKPLSPELDKTYRPFIPVQPSEETAAASTAPQTAAKAESTMPGIGGIPVFRSTVSSGAPVASRPTAAEAPAKPGAGPIFLHRESLFEPIKPKVEFKLEFPGEEKSATRDIHPAPHSPSPLAWLKNASPAPGGKIMIKTPPSGHTQNPLPPSFGKTDTTPKVVHYNEGKSAIESLKPAQNPTGIPIADLNAPKEKPAFAPIAPLIKKDEVRSTIAPPKPPLPAANLSVMSSSPRPATPPVKPTPFVPPPAPPKPVMPPRPIAPPSPFSAKVPLPPPPPKPGFTPGPKRIDLASL